MASLSYRVRVGGADMLQEFKAFIERGNVIDLAVAVIIGAAFGKIVTTFVEGILMPPLGLALGGVDFSSLFIVLDHAKGTPASLTEAKTAGMPVIAYGAFINEIINFLIVAFAMFLLVKQANRFKGPGGGHDQGMPEMPVSDPAWSEALRGVLCRLELKRHEITKTRNW